MNAGLFVVVSGVIEATLTGNIFMLLATLSNPLASYATKTQTYPIDVILESDCFGEEFVLDAEEPALVSYVASK